MTRYDPVWLEAQYNNRARIPEHPQIFERWAQASQMARDGLSRRLDVAYGPGAKERLDVFPSTQQDAPVLFFIHGGYWRSLDKSDVAFIAPSFVNAGAMVVLPNYDLCPEVGMPTIALQMTQALAWVYRHAALYGGDPERIVVAGHSAGGHLATMLLCCDWKVVGRDLPPSLVKDALSISGLYDLEPLRHAAFLQDDLKLTPKAVRQLSPVNFPAPRGRLFTVAGTNESDEFLRQNLLIQKVWGHQAVPVCETVAGANHLDILHELVDAKARLHGLAKGLLGL
jgi:arylformamidase